MKKIFTIILIILLFSNFSSAKNINEAYFAGGCFWCMEEFFEKVEGPLGLCDCFYDANCMQIEFCNIRTPIQRINNNMINMFRSMSVQDITN